MKDGGLHNLGLIDRDIETPATRWTSFYRAIIASVIRMCRYTKNDAIALGNRDNHDENCV